MDSAFLGMTNYFFFFSFGESFHCDWIYPGIFFLPGCLQQGEWMKYMALQYLSCHGGNNE